MSCMQKIKTSDFVFSKQAKKLPEIISINEEVAYILGLWKADRCSTAKGIVGLRNKDSKLLNAFGKFINKMQLETKERTVTGYGKTKEIYCCSMPLRRILEFIAQNRLELLDNQNLVLSYIAGLIDGDGSTGNLSHLVIFYNRDEIQDAEIDAKLIKRLGFNTTIKEKRNHLRLYILNPKNLIKKLFAMVVLKRKLVAS